MKSYTNLEQSKKLAEILPLESADMHYIDNHYEPLMLHLGFCNDLYEEYKSDKWDYIPCWSLAALLNILPSSTLDSSFDHWFRIECNGKFTDWHDNAIDACYEMIIKFHEQNFYDYDTRRKSKKIRRGS